MTGFYHYRGSLTIPECGEIVQWIIIDKPLIVKRAERRGLPLVSMLTQKNLSYKWTPCLLFIVKCLEEKCWRKWQQYSGQFQAYTGNQWQDCFLLKSECWGTMSRTYSTKKRFKNSQSQVTFDTAVLHFLEGSILMVQQKTTQFELLPTGDESSLPSCLKGAKTGFSSLYSGNALFQNSSM